MLVEIGGVDVQYFWLDDDVGVCQFLFVQVLVYD